MPEPILDFALGRDERTIHVSDLVYPYDRMQPLYLVVDIRHYPRGPMIQISEENSNRRPFWANPKGYIAL